MLPEDQQLIHDFEDAYPGYRLGPIVQLYQPGWKPGSWYSFVTQKPNGALEQLIQGFGSDMHEAIAMIENEIEKERANKNLT